MDGMANFSTDEKGELVADDAEGTKIWPLHLKRCFSLEILQQQKKKKSKHPGQDFPIIVDLGAENQLTLIPKNHTDFLPETFGE